MTGRLRIRGLRLDVLTNVGRAGRTLVFEDGLNVLRADNSSGKSTSLQAIVYALGLEGMLSARREVPLAHVMTDNATLGTVDAQVLESSVEVEIENGVGERISVRRYVKSDRFSASLVQVRRVGPGAPSSQVALEEYFVRRPGAAVREAGFHTFLATFIGWDLPRVTRADGSEGLLYLETLFPFSFVEQKHGWSGIQARIPTYLGIRDVAKRSTEFILKMDAADRILERQRISSNLSRLEADWQQQLKDLSDSARRGGCALERVPTRVREGLTEDAAIPLTTVADRWVRLEAALELLTAEGAALRQRPIRTSGEAAEEVSASLRAAEFRADSELATLGVVRRERALVGGEASQLELRIEALAEDLQRHKDTLTLVQLGGEIGVSLLADHVCPTCHQAVADGSDLTEHAMTAAENIAFIERQLGTYRSSLSDSRRVLDALSTRENALAESVRESRTEIRAARSTLTSENDAPSVSDVTRLVSIDARIALLSGTQEELERTRSVLRNTAEDWAAQRARLDELESSDLSPEDRLKLSDIQQGLQTQLHRYSFSSLPPSQVEISPDTYRPAHEGFDLGFDLSASDMIRLIWSYLISVLAVSQARDANHLGLLIFDEPRQQETAIASYQALLQQATEQGAAGSQLIFATSETEQSLLGMLDPGSCNLIALAPGEKLIQLLD